ncbi:hypothetical protein M662_10475 [Bacillus sp. SB49]|uniref:metallophosphoesterase n=1 Tax=Bacillus sp. SB49 TaxID=1071080 RepID=UPI00040E395F|nr:metallophosphoesterase [Bacillus sp. SB49]QHT46898.1 hypothetical protein M662_10475 [Bacillus sp. SB49]
MWWILSIAVLGMVVILLFMVHSAFNDRLERKEVKLAAYPYEKPLELLFLSDVHNRRILERSLLKYPQPELIIIGGDFVDERTSREKLVQNVQTLQKAGAPVYFIPGNNDHEYHGQKIIAELAALGVQTLSNEDAVIKINDERRILLRGLDPYYLGTGPRSFRQNPGDVFSILCIHDPYVYHRMHEENKARFSLVLSGHTHGGQVRLFGLGPYKRGGWAGSAEQMNLVSEGYGTSALPLRLGTRAELHSIQILPAAKGYREKI